MFFILFHQPPPACVSPLSSPVSPAHKSPFFFLVRLICMQIRLATQMRRAGRGAEGRVKVSGRWGRTGRRARGMGGQRRKGKERRRRCRQSVTSRFPNRRRDSRLADVQREHAGADAWMHPMTSRFCFVFCHFLSQRRTLSILPPHPPPAATPPSICICFLLRFTKTDKHLGRDLIIGSALPLCHLPPREAPIGSARLGFRWRVSGSRCCREEAGPAHFL